MPFHRECRPEAERLEGAAFPAWLSLGAAILFPEAGAAAGAMTSEETEYRPPFCSSPACRLLSSAAFIGSGVWVFSGISRSQAGQMWRPNRKIPHLQLFLSVGLISWGLTILIRPGPRRSG